MSFERAAVAVAFLLTAWPVAAQVADPVALPVPAPVAETPICTDRPTKANIVCSVPAGTFQVETDLVNWTRSTAPGAQTDVVLYTNPTFKYGVSATTDVEVNISPYATARTRSGGAVDTLSGVGDLYLRVKQQLTRAVAPVTLALIPYIKAPTAKPGIGNGKVEGGVIAPIVFDLPGNLTLDLGPEIDILANSSGHGRHAQLVGLVNIAESVGKATFYAELWTAQNFDPARTVRQYSADVAVTYLLTPTLQADVGGNFGLNKATPGVQLYLGLSKRF